MKQLDYSLSAPSEIATLGVVVLQSDQSLEADMRRILHDPRLALHVTRIPSDPTLSTETIAQMGRDLPAAAALLPAHLGFDAVAYACTSGTTLIGPDRVASLIRSVCDARTICTPLTAALDAFKALEARRIGIVSPYPENIAQSLSDAFTRYGAEVATALSFGEAVEERVVRISPDSLRRAARAVTHSADVDAVFLSCTNLRTLDVIPDLEAELGIPVVSSNTALCWSMAKACDANMQVLPCGRLLQSLG